MEDLVKIKFEQLGKVFSNKLAIEENINISDDIRDWKDDISNASHETIEEKDNRYLDLCRIEYKDRNGIPSSLEFYEESIFDNDDYIIDINYYIENYDSKYLKTEFLEEIKKETETESIMLIEKLQDNLKQLKWKVNSVYDDDINKALVELQDLKESMMRW